MMNTVKCMISTLEWRIIKMIQTEKVKLGIVKPAKKQHVSDEVVKECYENGMSAYKIGQQFGMTHQAIIYRLKKMGIYITGGRK